MKETLQEKLARVQAQMMLESHNLPRFTELQEELRRLIEEGMRTGELYRRTPNRRTANYWK